MLLKTLGPIYQLSERNYYFRTSSREKLLFRYQLSRRNTYFVTSSKSNSYFGTSSLRETHISVLRSLRETLISVKDLQEKLLFRYQFDKRNLISVPVLYMFERNSYFGTKSLREALNQVLWEKPSRSCTERHFSMLTTGSLYCNALIRTY